jgi:hypothetical protein
MLKQPGRSKRRKSIENACIQKSDLFDLKQLNIDEEKSTFQKFINLEYLSEIENIKRFQKG